MKRWYGGSKALQLHKADQRKKGLPLLFVCHMYLTMKMLRVIEGKEKKVGRWNKLVMQWGKDSMEKMSEYSYLQHSLISELWSVQFDI